jgi:hypothetical protein
LPAPLLASTTFALSHNDSHTLLLRLFFKLTTLFGEKPQLKKEQALKSASVTLFFDYTLQQTASANGIASRKLHPPILNRLTFFCMLLVVENANSDLPPIEGPFQLPTNIPKHFGGSGTNQWAWALCDAPTIIYSLAKFGLRKDEQVQKAVKYLVNLVHENGWRCVVSKELGKFRGPGRKDDPCPYATLAMLKMLSQFNEWKQSDEAHVGGECLLDLWKRSLKLHPYMFYMGTDFRKIKAPFIWYDILHVLDVLSQFEWLRNDSRLTEISDIVKSKADNEGKYTPESIWKTWKDWDFGQKKKPSRWLTFLVLNVLRRIS